MGDQNLMKAPRNRWLSQVSKTGVLRERSRQFDAFPQAFSWSLPSTFTYDFLSSFLLLFLSVMVSPCQGWRCWQQCLGNPPRCLCSFERERVSGAPWCLSNLTQLTSCNIWSKCFKKEGKEEPGLRRVVTRMSRRPWKESQLQLKLCKVN